LARRLGAVHLSVDPVEDAMLGAGLDRSWAVGVAAYEAVRAAAEQNLELGWPVVVDAVNDSEPARQTWRSAAAAHDSRLTLVDLVCTDRDEHRERLEGRTRGLSNIAEPLWREVMVRAAAYEPWIDPHLIVDSSRRRVDDVVEDVLAHVLGRDDVR
jgi:predicted kinase